MNSHKVVMTTIFAPSEAVMKFAQMDNVDLIVVGDKKSPAEWEVNGVDYLPWDDQRLTNWNTYNRLPFNHYSRKNLGYLRAIESGAEAIIDTDDDNIPHDNFSFPPFDAKALRTEPELGFINVYSFFTAQKIWPRGLPLHLVLRNDSNLRLQKAQAQVGVWQGLANGDPDVDAIYRLTVNEPCEFQTREPVLLAEGTWSPFNSQNTLFRKELFPLLYLPVTVSFRFTDILRSLVAQPIMWETGYELGISNASVYQARNPHDYMADLASEIPMYVASDTLIDTLTDAQKSAGSVLERLWRAWESLIKTKTIDQSELTAVSAWISDCEALGYV